MIDGNRVVAVIEAVGVENLRAILPMVFHDETLDEIAIVDNTKDPAVKAEVLFAKHADSRVKIVSREIIQYVMRKCTVRGTVYVYISPSVFWISPNAVSTLVQHHLANPRHFITYMSDVAGNRTAYIMQVMGMFPDGLIHPWHPQYIDAFHLDSAEARDEIHEQVLFAINARKYDALNYGMWYLTLPHETAGCAFCFNGKDMERAAFFVKTGSCKKLSHAIYQAASMAAEANNGFSAMCGAAWYATDVNTPDYFRGRFAAND